jgi:hypothetical protein
MTSGRPYSSSQPVLADTHIRVRHSAIHGNGVFATRKIPAGARIIEYAGKRITEVQAEKRFGLDPDNPHHTFFFSLKNFNLIGWWVRIFSKHLMTQEMAEMSFYSRAMRF